MARATAKPLLTARTFLVRGLLAGLVAGLITFGVAYLIGEPSVEAAIALETAGSTADAGSVNPDLADTHAEGSPGHEHAEELVSRATQSTWGLATGTIVFGTALGGVVGLATAFAVGRLGRLSPRACAAVLATVGFVAVYLVPYFTYPPNPPAVGNPDTIGQRTGWYFALVAISVVAAVLALVVASRMRPRLGGWTAGVTAGVGYLAVTGLVAVLMPAFDEVGEDFPASLLWEFRVSSLIIQAVLWAVIGLVLGALLQRVVVRGADSSDRRALAGRPA